MDTSAHERDFLPGAGALWYRASMAWRGAVSILLAAAGAAFAAGGPAYVGAAACAKCHAEEQRRWSQSRHSKMVQPATAASVKGDFSREQVTLRGSPYKLREKDGVYYIAESYLSGKEQEHRVDYTLGNRRIQHYLTTLPSGRVIVLPPSWDVLRKQWFHNSEIDDPDETSEVMVQVWNKNCYSCHVSREEKNFNAAANEYKTAWQDFGTNCERCHGPGSEHVAHYTAAGKPVGPARDIVLQTRLSPARNTMVCAQCHSLPRHPCERLLRRRRLLRLLPAHPGVRPAGRQGPRLLAGWAHAALLQRRVRFVAE